MKILFVEDELSKNIPRIIRLFGKYLGKKRIERLEALESDPSGYGASPEEIKAIVDETGIVEAAYRFPEALRKITHHHERYVLFIVDRNLAESDYRYADATAADTSFSEKHHETYWEREGDYLLYRLAFKGVDVRQKFFFMTAYDAASELKNAGTLEEMIGHFGDFKALNFIEKGNEEHLSRLKQRIDEHRDLSRIAEHQHHINLLRKYLDEDGAGRFINIVLRRDDPGQVGDNLNELRQIYQKILSACCKIIPGMDTPCVDNYGKVSMGKQCLDWLSDQGHINSVIRNHAFSIQKICSAFGSHDNPTERDIFDPQTDTVNALFFALKDIIGWFGKIQAKYGVQ